MDEETGYVYLPFGTPTNDFYGGHRPGNGLYGNSLVAVDLARGSAQVVLRDVPKTGGSGNDQTPRWLGKTNSLSSEDRRVIVNRDLARIEATGVEFGPDQTRYRDSNGKAQSIATGSILMVLPAALVEKQLRLLEDLCSCWSTCSTSLRQSVAGIVKRPLCD